MSNQPSDADQRQRQVDSRTGESIAAMRFIRLGYQPLGLSETEIRGRFHFHGPCADMVFRRGPSMCIVVEKKSRGGTARAVTQLQHTAQSVRRDFAVVDPVLLSSLSGEKDKVDLSDGYCAVKDRSNGTYGLQDSQGRPVRVAIGGEQIRVVFGP